MDLLFSKHPDRHCRKNIIHSNKIVPLFDLRENQIP